MAISGKIAIDFTEKNLGISIISIKEKKKEEEWNGMEWERVGEGMLAAYFILFFFLRRLF